MKSAIPKDEPAIPWRLRSDLQIQAANSGADGTRWTIKDPLRLTYFSADAEEMAFLKLLDGDPFEIQFKLSPAGPPRIQKYAELDDTL